MRRKTGISLQKRTTRYKSYKKWIVLCIALVGIHYAYYDCVDAVRNSVNVWYALFDRDFLNFYSYTRYAEHEITFTVFSSIHNGASYSYLAYLFFGIWTFPLFLLERFFSVNLFWHSWGVIYAKLGLILVSFLNARLIKGIVVEATDEEERGDLAEVLYLTSSFFFSCTVAVGQLEAITILFMLLGFRFYLKDSPLFLLFFAAAIPFKYFALLALIPLLLIKEKNVLKLAGKTLLVIAPTAASFVVFLQDQYKRVGVMEGSNRPIGDNVFHLLADGMMSSGSTWKSGDISFNLFFVAVILIWIWCYLKKTENREEQLRNALFGTTATLLSFILFFQPVYPYWCTLLLPFEILAILINAKDINTAVIADTVAGSSYVFWQMIRYHWVFGLYAMQSNIFLSEGQPYATTGVSLLNYLDLVSRTLGISITSLYLLGFGSLLLVAYAFLMMRLYPRNRGDSSCEGVGRSVIVTRLILASGTLLVNAICVYLLMRYKSMI